MAGDAVTGMRERLAEEGIHADEQTLRTFFVGCEGDVDVAIQKLRNYLELKRTTPEWFANRDPNSPDVSRLLDLGVMFPMPAKDDRGRTVMIVRATANDPKSNPMTDVFKAGMMVVDLAICEDETIARNGVSVVIDLEGVRLGHALQMTPRLVRRAIHSWQDCYPLRIAGIDFVNCPPHVDVVLNIFKRFAREKLRRRMRTHQRGVMRLGDVINLRCLPHEYGGSWGPAHLVAREWAEKVKSRRDWFVANSTGSN